MSACVSQKKSKVSDFTWMTQWSETIGWYVQVVGDCLVGDFTVAAVLAIISLVFRVGLLLLFIGRLKLGPGYQGLDL